MRTHGLAAYLVSWVVSILFVAAIALAYVVGVIVGFVWDLFTVND